MANDFVTAGRAKRARLRIVDKHQNPARLDGVPVWESSNPDILTVTPDDDGMSCLIKSVGGMGTAQITVRADADLGEGVTELMGAVALDVMAGQASVLALFVDGEEFEIEDEPETPDEPTEPEAPTTDEPATDEPGTDEPTDPDAPATDETRTS